MRTNKISFIKVHQLLTQSKTETLQDGWFIDSSSGELQLLSVITFISSPIMIKKHLYNNNPQLYHISLLLLSGFIMSIMKYLK